MVLRFSFFQVPESLKGILDQAYGMVRRSEWQFLDVVIYVLAEWVTVPRLSLDTHIE